MAALSLPSWAERADVHQPGGEQEAVKTFHPFIQLGAWAVFGMTEP